MRRLLNSIRRSLRTKPAAANATRSFRPHVEQLDERLVLSPLSSAIGIEHAWGTEHDWYTVEQSTGYLVEFKDTSRVGCGLPGGTGYFLGISASIDPDTGSGEVFALQYRGYHPYGSESIYWYYNALELCNSHGWYWSSTVPISSISATRDGHVYAATTDGWHVRYYDSKDGWTDLGAPPKGLPSHSEGSIDPGEVAASLNRFGGNEVFVIGQDRAIYVNSSNTYGDWRLVDNSGQFAHLSATTNNSVFALTSTGLLYQEIEQFQATDWGGYFYWSSQYIYGGINYYYTSISADTDALGRDEVYVIDVNAKAWLYNASNQVKWTAKDSGVYSIAAAGDGYFYDVNYASGNYYGFQWNPNGSDPYVFNPYGSAGAWTYLGSGLS